LDGAVASYLIKKLLEALSFPALSVQVPETVALALSGSL
jgi:hypothetical protein